MRQLAGVVGSIGLIVAAVIALWPVTVEVRPGGDGRCGPPLVRVAAQEHVDDPNEQAVIDRCEDEAAGPMVLAGIAAGTGALAFVALRLAAERHDVVVARRKHMARQRAARDEHGATLYQARVEEATARDAALRG